MKLNLALALHRRKLNFYEVFKKRVGCTCRGSLAAGDGQPFMSGYLRTGTFLEQSVERRGGSCRTANLLPTPCCRDARPQAATATYGDVGERLPGEFCRLPGKYFQLVDPTNPAFNTAAESLRDDIQLDCHGQATVTLAGVVCLQQI